MRRSGTPRRPAWHCAGLGLAESGLVDTTDTDTVNLVVTENFTDFASAASVANTSYSNVAPSVSGAGGTNEVDFSITFAATSDDGDLVANAVVAGFETLVLDFRYLQPGPAQASDS